MPADSPLERRIRDRMAALAGGGLLRTLAPPSGIDLCSNDYLGLSRHPHVLARFAEAAKDECGSTGSRLLRGERVRFEQVEARFAHFKGTERSLYFSSGYLANLAVLTALPEEGDLVLSDARNHASLIDGTRLSRARCVVFPHNDTAAVRRLIADAPPHTTCFIVTESLFSMDGDEAPLAEYVDICRATGAVLIVDEAHAVGIYGCAGAGLLSDSASVVCVSINTAGKALGVGGAFVAGPQWAIDYLVQRARPFVFSTAPPPAQAAALDASLDVIRDEPDRRERLLARAAYLRRRLGDSGIDIPAGRSQIVPVTIGDNEAAVAVARVLQHEGFDVRAIRPPSVPAGTARLRISLNADLSETILDRFVHTVAAALKEAGLCSAVSS